MKKHALFVAGVLAAGAGVAQAATVTFTHTGRGSGTIGMMTFTDAAFRIVSVGDTSQRNSFVGGWWIDHASSVITIDGIGALTVQSATRTFVNNTAQLVGYSRTGSSSLDLFNGPSSAEFGSWNMTTDIGPVSGTGTLQQWATPAVNTDRGVLVFNSGASAATFRAVVPAPGVGVALGIGLAAVGRRRRR